MDWSWVHKPIPTVSPESFMAWMAALMILVSAVKFFWHKKVSFQLYVALMAWLLFFLAAELSIYRGWITSMLIPAPTSVLWKLQYHLDSGYMQVSVAATMTRFFIGFVIAIATAIPLGIAMGFLRWVFDWLEPAMNFVRMIPPPAILPLAIILFGIGEAPAVFVIALGCFFPMFLGAIRGVGDTETIHCEVVETMGGSRFDVMIHAVIPSAIPAIMSGVRTGFGIGWLVLVSAEAIAIDNGLGFIVQAKVDTAMIWMGLCAICVSGLAIDFALKKVERLLTPHREFYGIT